MVIETAFRLPKVGQLEPYRRRRVEQGLLVPDEHYPVGVLALVERAGVDLGDLIKDRLAQLGQTNKPAVPHDHMLGLFR
jgi:hypothetical protein